MVIKRSPGGPCRWRAVNFEIHLWSSGMNADCIWRSICIQHVQVEAGLNSDPGNDSFWDKSVTLTMLIDLLTSTCRSTQVEIASTDLWPQGMFTFSEMLELVESESSFGAYVCHRRPGGSLATSDLVRCMCVCMCVIVVIWAEWADVGLWVAVCFLAKISLQRPTCKTTFASLTQSQAISQSFRVFISCRSMRVATFFHFSKLFLYKITVSFTMVIKRSPGGPYRWRAVNFEIHLWSSGMNGADCIWRSISIQHVQLQVEAGLNSDPGNDSFWDKIRGAKHVDRSTH